MKSFYKSQFDRAAKKRKIGVILLPVLLYLFGSDCIYSADLPKEGITLSLPGLNWILDINSPGFKIEQKEISEKEDKTKFFANNDKTGVVISGFLERVPKIGTSKDCRDHYWGQVKSKSPLKMDNIMMSDFGQMAIVEYVVKEVKGVEINQRHLNAYLAEDKYWIDIHISKSNFKPEDESLFKSILKNIKINRSYHGEKNKVDYQVPNHGALVLNVPKDWLDEIGRPPKDLPPTFTFTPQSGEPFNVLITAMWDPNQQPGFNNSQNVRRMVEGVWRESGSQAMEKEMKICDLKGNDFTGHYITLTDKTSKSKPGDYKYMTQGGLGVGDLELVFTILSNKKDFPITEALEMIRSSCQLKKLEKGNVVSPQNKK